MKVIEGLDELRVLRREWQSETIALVPTMGALHAGHLSLFEKAKALGTKFAVSIYVNPLQFGPNEDFERYPRSMEQDLAHCEHYGADLVFVPDPKTLHPNGYETITHVHPPSQITNQLCGLTRPQYFGGVATIVLKLFQLVQPQFAVFGEKDAQQLAVIQRMVQDLNLPVEITPASTVREPDGLAMSSRNWYFKTDTERQQARLLSRLLISVQELYKHGIETAEDAFSLAQDRVLDAELYPDFELEYLAAVKNISFLPTEILDEKARILVAAKVGNVRLIDNTMLTVPLAFGVPQREFVESL